MPKTRRASFQAIQGHALAAFRWWLGELSSMLPDGVIRFIKTGRSSGTVLLIDVEHVVLVAGENRLIRDDKSLHPELLPMRAASNLDREGLAVILTPVLAFVTSVVFPLTAASQLGSILGHHLPLLVPLEENDAAFDYHVSARNEVTKTVSVQIAIIKQETLSRAINCCQALGCEPASVRLLNSLTPGQHFDFYNSAAGSKAASSARLTGLLTATILILAVSVVGISRWRISNTEGLLADKIGVLSQKAPNIILLQHRLMETKKQLAFINSRLGESPRVLVLDEIAKLLPDSSWLNELSIDGTKITIAGNAKTATDIIAAIHKSPLFINPEFSAPIYAWQDGTQRFEMSFLLGQSS